MARVRIDSVTQRFGGAVAGVSLDIPSGKLLTILGPSGCGKTATLRMVSGLTLPDAGRILIGGRDVTEVPSHKRNIAMVFQSHALFPHMTVADNVAFGLRMRGMGRPDREGRAMAALAMVRLDAIAGGFRPSFRAAGSSAWRWSPPCPPRPVRCLRPATA